mmetsp:Transcript_8633/g.14582  ORF Transcript_8633/g.14582 Transcript_8633/m.14582 type:complete len:247 (-) Transcript_8633:2523-3263(-)
MARSRATCTTTALTGGCLRDPLHLVLRNTSAVANAVVNFALVFHFSAFKSSFVLVGLCCVFILISGLGNTGHDFFFLSATVDHISNSRNGDTCLRYIRRHYDESMAWRYWQEDSVLLGSGHECVKRQNIGTQFWHGFTLFILLNTLTSVCMNIITCRSIVLSRSGASNSSRVNTQCLFQKLISHTVASHECTLRTVDSAHKSTIAVSRTTCSTLCALLCVLVAIQDEDILLPGLGCGTIATSGVHS